MELLFVAILSLITMATAGSIFFSPCRAIVFPTDPASSLIRFAPPFLVGMAVITLEAVLILSQLQGLSLARSFVWVTRAFALVNGLVWGFMNVYRDARPFVRFFMPSSFLLFSGVMILPISRTLQLFLLVSVVVISSPIGLIYAATWIFLYLALVKGKLSGIICKIFCKHREDIDVFLSEKKRLIRMALILLLTVPVLLWIVFLAGTYFGWIAIPGLH